jgi:hypothetical protein
MLDVSVEYVCIGLLMLTRRSYGYHVIHSGSASNHIIILATSFQSSESFRFLSLFFLRFTFHGVMYVMRSITRLHACFP